MQKQWQVLLISRQVTFGNMEGLAKTLSKGKSSKARCDHLLMLKILHDRLYYRTIIPMV